jgi:hypothetical protein
VTDAPSRNQQTPLSHEQAAFLTELQGLEADFISLCGKMGKSRELSLAITNMEQASMWAIRHLLGTK